MPFSELLPTLPFAESIKVHLDEGKKQIAEEGMLSSTNAKAELYICGSQNFMSETIKKAEQMGWPDSQIFSESFTPRDREVGIPCSCTQGICGSCMTPFISGDVEHRDAILTEKQRESFMCFCVGSAKGGRLVLDV